MDLNPDEAIAAGWLREKSLTARVLFRMLGYSLKRAERIIVLDRFMQQRIIAKGIAAEKIAIIPPWSHNDAVALDQEGRARFRAANNLTDKYVVMYSGNHSPCHSLDTLLGAALELGRQANIAFCFVGGGSEYHKVKAYAQQNKLSNIICLPYQPLNELSASLSAADLHVVVMGDLFTGIVHPCKIYNILEIGSPVLYVGPTTSHVVDVVSKLEDQDLICSARHGDVETVAGYILAGAQTLNGRRSASAVKVAATFSRDALVPRVVGLIEGTAELAVGGEQWAAPQEPNVYRLGESAKDQKLRRSEMLYVASNDSAPPEL
jgi:hypothetical protein